MRCAYCGKTAELVGGLTIYPARWDLRDKNFYRCVPCGAYVGCHGLSKTPLGRLANAELRKAKSEAHLHFDKVWKSGIKTRSEAYAWLAIQLNIPKEDCHIGYFDVDTCKRVVTLCT